MAFKIDMGVSVTDCLTGFAGIVSGRVEYITGCNQYLVSGKAAKGKSGEALWFDENRLILKNVRDLVASRSEGQPLSARGGPPEWEAPRK